MPDNNMPPDWEPPAPAWESKWKDDEEPLVVGYFGIQATAPDKLETWANRAFKADNGPAAVEQGRYVDQQGVSNFIYIAYWRQSAYRAWWADEANNAWWRSSQRTQESSGYWREIFAMPVDHLETLHSSESSHGVGALTDDLEGPIKEHGYPGGMRDRIPISDAEDLNATVAITEPLRMNRGADNGGVLVNPPQKMCIIRSGQNWSLCDGAERTHYIEKVHPVLLKGMRFLRDNPVESNCYSLRFINKTDVTWTPVEETFGLGYATDVQAFENWAKSHPTHVAIFESFLQMTERFGDDIKLRLWHEVSVLPAQGSECEYIGCHSDTGMLKYT